MEELSTYSLQDACIKYAQITGEQITESYLINLALNKKIKLVVLYDGFLNCTGKMGNGLIEHYGWLVPLPRFYVELIANGSSNVNMLTNIQEDSTFTLLSGKSKSITITISNLFITASTLDHLAGHRPVNNKTKGRRDNQLNIILDYINQNKWPTHMLPFGAKAQLKDYCVNNHKFFFTENSFDHAWKEGLRRAIFKTADHDKYSNQ